MYKLFYTDNLPEGVGGRCEYPFPKLFGFGTPVIKIRPKYEKDFGLLNHEVAHVKQYKSNPFHAIMYKLSKKYRYKCEIEAYKMQRATKEVEEWIIEAMLNKYNLNVDRNTIIQDLL